MKLITQQANIGHWALLYRDGDGDTLASGPFYSHLPDAERHARYLTGEAVSRRVWVVEVVQEFKSSISVQEVIQG